MKIDFQALKENLGPIETSIALMQNANWISQQERVQLMYAVSKLYVFIESMISENNGIEIIDTEAIDTKEVST